MMMLSILLPEFVNASKTKKNKHSITGTTQDHDIFFTHGAYWVRILAPGHMYRSFSILLVITDHFKRYTQVYSIRNKEAKTAATKLFNDCILRFGTPGKTLHDQGREFENKSFTHLPKLCNIERLRITPYHSQCNGQVERMNKSIIAILKTLEETERKS